MSIILGNGGVKNVKEIYVGVNGSPRKVKEGYVGVGGVPRKFYSAISYDPILNNNTWEQISEASKSGLALSLWNVGDTKDIVINGTVGVMSISGLSIQVFILGFNHNSSKEGTNRIHFGIGKLNGNLIALVDSSYGGSASTSGKFTMNTSDSNSGGWYSSHMRNTVLGSATKSSSGSTLMAALPSDLRAVMKSVTKYTDNTGGGKDVESYVNSTTDYLWLLAEFEVFGEKHNANSAEQNYQEQYAYFKSGNSRIAYRHSATGTTCWWWLRSPYRILSYYFCAVITSGIGSYSADHAYYSGGLVAAFAV